MADTNQFLEIHEIIQVVAEMMGGKMSDAAAFTMAGELSEYPRPDIERALKRCAAECTRLRLADVLQRIPGCHPTADEAWAVVSHIWGDESASVVWTDEMAQAYGLVRRMSDQTAARMAFRETYRRLVGESESRTPQWVLSAGRDPVHRHDVVQRAIRDGKLPKAHPAAMELLPPKDTRKHTSGDVSNPSDTIAATESIIESLRPAKTMQRTSASKETTESTTEDQQSLRKK